jgi:hypothetical protein
MKKIYISIASVIFLFIFLPKSVLAVQHKIGTNVKTPEGSISAITKENGVVVRRSYTSAGAFLSYSFNSWKSVVKASIEDMGLPAGTFISPRDGSIFCSDRGEDKGTCYIISVGEKYGFTSEDIFRKFGYQFRFSVTGDVSWMPLGEHLLSDSNDMHPDGTIIYSPDVSPRIYLLVTTSGLYIFPDIKTLKSWGYSIQDAVIANNADKAIPVRGSIIERKEGEINILKTVTYAKMVPSSALEFRIHIPKLQASSTLENINEWASTGLTEKYLKRAVVDYSKSNTYSKVDTLIKLEFNEEGRILFAKITEDNIGKTIGIFVNNVLISSPMVRDIITDGTAVISGNFTFEEAQKIVSEINSKIEVK